MSYPESLISDLAKAHRLSESSINLLTAALSVKGMKELIEDNICPVSQIFRIDEHGGHEIVSESDAQQIVAACNVSGMRDLLSSGRLSVADLIVIAEGPGSHHDLSVLSESYAQAIVEDPARLSEIRARVANPHLDRVLRM